MGRGRVEIKRIENTTSRQVTFSKRRGGLLKKAHELAVLCDAQVGVVIFSSRGKLSEYCSPPCSWTELIHRYETISNTQLQETNHADQQMFAKITRHRHESDHLEASLRRQTGEDLSSVVTVEELNNLQQQLELTLSKVRERKDELLNQQLDDSHHKVHILEDQNSFLRHMIAENGQRRAAGETSAVAAEGMPPALPASAFTGFFPEEEEEASTSLQLWPRLQDVNGFGYFQPTQPDLQDSSLAGHGLTLW